MTTLVVAEHDGVKILQPTLSTVRAATEIGSEVHVLVIGHQVEGVVKEASHIDGVSKIMVADSADYKHGLPEDTAALILSLAGTYSHIAAPATTSGKDYLPRVAALLDVDQISEVTYVVAPDIFRRSIYAGSAIATVQSTANVTCITVRPTSFQAATLKDSETGVEVKALEIVASQGRSKFVSDELASSDRPDLTAARIVVSGGRGMGSAENFGLLHSLADKLGAAVGASRAAVDAGFVPNDMQVGQTGKVVAPDLYIAAGISGAIQHLAGMKDSKVIVAINMDEEAPIFQIADYGIIGDLFAVVPALEAGLSD